MSDQYFAHERALVDAGARIGPGTRVWAFAHVLGGAVIGSDCNICDQTFIENDVVIGDRVTIKCGVQVWDGVRLEDDVFVGPNATFTNDPFPRSKHYPEKFKTTHVRRGASIGANATILPGIEIGQYAMVGAGAVVTKNVPPHAIVAGNPATIRGMAGRREEREKQSKRPSRTAEQLRVSGARIIALPLASDERQGVVATVGHHIPFVPKSFSTVPGPSYEARNAGAYRDTHHVVVAVTGSVLLMVDDGSTRDVVSLMDAADALYIPPLVWVAQLQSSRAAILTIFSSGEGVSEERIEVYEDFLRIRREA
jgi:UDP-2-acetamido-3-amino-2,3-dideoxy-glucuronate N-acetyltransferase